MAKPRLKQKAIRLRKKGYSYNLILKEVSVAKSTLSEWLRDVPYEPNEKVKNRIKGAQVKAREWKRRNKKKSLENAQKEAVDMIGEFTQRDLLMLGLGLYIGEGGKGFHITRFVNSDPQVVCVALKWFEEIFGLKKKNFRLKIHLYPDNDIEKSLNFWSDVTGIPRSQFGKTQIDRRKKKSKKRKMLKYGTVHVVIVAQGEKKFGVFLLRKILAMIREVYRRCV